MTKEKRSVLETDKTAEVHAIKSGRVTHQTRHETRKKIEEWIEKRNFDNQFKL